MNRILVSFASITIGIIALTPCFSAPAVSKPAPALKSIAHVKTLPSSREEYGVRGNTEKVVCRKNRDSKKTNDLVYRPATDKPTVAPPIYRPKQDRLRISDAHANSAHSNSVRKM